MSGFIGKPPPAGPPPWAGDRDSQPRCAHRWVVAREERDRILVLCERCAELRWVDVPVGSPPIDPGPIRTDWG